MDDVKCGKYRKLQSMENGSSRYALIILASIASARIRRATFVEGRVATFATFIMIAVPFDCGKICIAIIIALEPIIKRIHVLAHCYYL